MINFFFRCWRRPLAETFKRSRSWVEEEGEVFRKGTFLLKPEELEGEYDSEVLRKEVCFVRDSVMKFYLIFFYFYFYF